MADPRYSQWRLEMKHLKETGQPYPEGQRHNRPDDAPAGFWRQRNARTKADHPIAIWFDGDRLCVKFGNKAEVASDEEVADFFAKGFLKCEAVLRDPDPKYPNIDDWSTALATGSWRDGKPIRMQSAEEKADIIPSTPASEGGNAPEGGDILDQVRERLETAARNIKALGIIDTMHKANLVAGILEPARAAWKMGEDERKRQKAPWDAGSDAVQAIWKPILDPAAVTLKAANDAAVAFAKREEKRLADEAAAARREKEKRIADELAEKRKAEAAEQARQAEAMSMEYTGPTEEEIDADAQAEAAAAVAQMPQADTKVRIGTDTGRGLSKPTQRVGEIVDDLLFFQQVRNDVDIKIALKKKADALARAKATVPGMNIVEK